MAEDSIDLRGLERQIDRIEFDLKNKPGLWTFLAIMLGAVFGALAAPLAMFLVWMPREIDRLESRLDQILAQNNRIETAALLSQGNLSEINVALSGLPNDIAKIAAATQYAAALPDGLWLDLIKSGKLGFVNFATLGSDGYLIINKLAFEEFPEELRVDLIEFAKQDKIHMIME